MTKSPLSFLCLAMLATSVLPAFSGEQTAYDHRAGVEDEGYYLLFCSRPGEDGTPGDAFVVVATGTDAKAPVTDTAYGLFDNAGSPDVGLVSSEYVAEVRSAATSNTHAVQVTEEHFAVARGLVAEWAERDDFLDEPDVVALNFCESLLGRIKMKKPFRPILSRADPNVYFADLTKLNRDRSVGE